MNSKNVTARSAEKMQAYWNFLKNYHNPYERLVPEGFMLFKTDGDDNENFDPSHSLSNLCN